jgi:hypothetical protein
MTRSIIHPPQIYLYIFQLFITPIFQFPHTFSINIYSSRLILRSINFLSPNHFLYLSLIISFPISSTTLSVSAISWFSSLSHLLYLLFPLIYLSLFLSHTSYSPILILLCVVHCSPNIVRDKTLSNKLKICHILLYKKFTFLQIK